MAQHEVDITITNDGKVTAHVKGAKGKACLEYAKWLEQTIGKIEQSQLTSEFYEPEEKARIDLKQELHNGDD